jgi:hypothetical protein
MVDLAGHRAEHEAGPGGQTQHEHHGQHADAGEHDGGGGQDAGHLVPVAFAVGHRDVPQDGRPDAQIQNAEIADQSQQHFPEPVDRVAEGDHHDGAHDEGRGQASGMQRCGADRVQQHPAAPGERGQGKDSCRGLTTAWLSAVSVVAGDG